LYPQKKLKEYSLEDIKGLAFHSFSVACISSDFVTYLIENGLVTQDVGCSIDTFLAAYFHDHGKWDIDPTVLFKNGRLDSTEMGLVMQHTVHNLKPSLYISEDVYRGIEEHHENYDGTGYPNNLTGDKISFPGRVLRITDPYDALRSIRSYKGKMSHEEAMIEMDKMEKCFDPVLYRHFKQFLATETFYINMYYEFIEKMQLKAQKQKKVNVV